MIKVKNYIVKQSVIEHELRMALLYEFDISSEYYYNNPFSSIFIDARSLKLENEKQILNYMISLSCEGKLLYKGKPLIIKPKKIL